jgi:hypothetical protein
LIDDDEYAWLTDVERPLIIGCDWQRQQALVRALPRWFYEPTLDVRRFFDALRAKDIETIKELGTEEVWKQVWAHVRQDFVAYLWHFCFYKNRDTRAKQLASPTSPQLSIAWRVMSMRHAKVPVFIDLLKERQGGFSWEMANLVGWRVMFNRNQGGLILAHDKVSTTTIFKYLKDAHEWLPDELRPKKQYSTRTELTLRNPKEEERRAGDVGLDSSALVQMAGSPFPGSGQPIQVMLCDEVGKWDKVCDPEETYTSVINAVQVQPDTVLGRIGTAAGAEKFWHHEFKRSLKIGKSGWNGHTPVFMPWFFDERNTSKCPPDTELDDAEESEFGNELELKRVYALGDGQLEWRRQNIQKQAGKSDDDERVSARPKVEVFKQEHPANPDEAWLYAHGKWLEAVVVAQCKARIEEQKQNGQLRVLFVGDMMPLRERGTDIAKPLKPEEEQNDWLRRRRYGALTIYRWPHWTQDYIVGCDLAEGIAGGDHTCIKVYQRVGYDFEQKRPMRLCAEWYGLIDPDDVADLLWRLGWFYSTGVGRHRVPAMLAWEKNNSGRSIAKWLRTSKAGVRDFGDAYPHVRMYRRHEPSSPHFKADASYGIQTLKGSKRMILDEWKRAARDGDLQLLDEDMTEAESLTVDDRGLVATDGRDRFMAAGMAVFAAQFTPVMFGQDDPEKKDVRRHTVAWAMQLHETHRAQDANGAIERIVSLTEDL